MTKIRAIDMILLDDIFEMGGGYVLNFSGRTFAQFFAVELGIDIGDPAYAQNGGSKSKRLRYFLQAVDRPTVVRTLNALWHYREALRQHLGQADKIEDAKGLVRRPKAEIDLWPSQIAATTPATDQSDDLVAHFIRRSVSALRLENAVTFGGSSSTDRLRLEGDLQSEAVLNSLPWQTGFGSRRRPRPQG